MARCQGVKGDGSPCGHLVKDGVTYCYAHDPDRAEERRANAARGGKVRRPLTELGEIKARIRKLAEGVVEGTVDKGRASVAFQGYGVLVRYYEHERRVRELDEIEKRLDELEAEQERRYGPGHTSGGAFGW